MSCMYYPGNVANKRNVYHYSTKLCHKGLDKALFIMCFATWIFFIQIMGLISHISNVSCPLRLIAENVVSRPFHPFSDTGTPCNWTAICPLTSSLQHLQYLPVTSTVKLVLYSSSQIVSPLNIYLKYGHYLIILILNY